MLRSGPYRISSSLTLSAKFKYVVVEVMCMVDDLLPKRAEHIVTLAPDRLNGSTRVIRLPIRIMDYLGVQHGSYLRVYFIDGQYSDLAHLAKLYATGGSVSFVVPKYVFDYRHLKDHVSMRVVLEVA